MRRGMFLRQTKHAAQLNWGETMISVNHNFTYMWVGNIEGWIFDNSEGKSLTLNSTALRIFKKMLDGKDCDQIINDFCIQCGKTRTEIAPSVERACKAIITFGVFENAGKEICV